MKLRALLIIVASVLAIDAMPHEAHALPLDICIKIDGTCDGRTNPTCTTNEDCIGDDLPMCDPRHGRCVGACLFDYSRDDVLPMACPEATRPLCVGDGALAGQCTECSASNATACVRSDRPVCVVATGNCGCNVHADCASGVCDEATRRCVEEALLPDGKASSGWGGAGASSSVTPDDRPSLSGYGVGSSGGAGAVDPGDVKGADAALPDDGRAEGGACAMAPTRGLVAPAATSPASMILGLALSLRAWRRRGA